MSRSSTRAAGQTAHSRSSAPASTFVSRPLPSATPPTVSLHPAAAAACRGLASARGRDRLRALLTTTELSRDDYRAVMAAILRERATDLLDLTIAHMPSSLAWPTVEALSEAARTGNNHLRVRPRDRAVLWASMLMSAHYGQTHAPSAVCHATIARHLHDWPDAPAMAHAVGVRSHLFVLADAAHASTAPSSNTPLEALPASWQAVLSAPPALLAWVIADLPPAVIHAHEALWTSLWLTTRDEHRTVLRRAVPRVAYLRAP